MPTITININCNITPRIALIKFNWIPGHEGRSVGDPNDCYEQQHDEFELECLNVQFGRKWVNMTSSIGRFEKEIIEQLEEIKIRYTNGNM